MGISTIQSYRGAQIFEAVGLGRRLVDRYFTGTVSRVGGLELPDIADEVAERHERGFPPARAGATSRSSTPAASTSSACAASTTPGTRDSIVRLQRAVRDDEHATLRGVRARRIDGADARLTTLRGLLELVPGGRADAARGGRAVGRDRQALRHRRDEPRLDLARGARDAGDRDEPASARAPTRARAARTRRARSPTPTATCGARRSSRSRRRASA